MIMYEMSDLYISILCSPISSGFLAYCRALALTQRISKSFPRCIFSAIAASSIALLGNPTISEGVVLGYREEDKVPTRTAPFNYDGVSKMICSSTQQLTARVIFPLPSSGSFSKM
ncbi:hypothetical protein BCR34DRAFT_578833 [Clohesyomyces aquaticus]|uniref:Uncharacterized protein n=1 Tax=Clohesyomyces aquaticus TaxID=1231657 RepID=A0A1Y1YF02_9PLEO|nr:hypothetical protein BCR34DRAFT_578833 [Clohesyomyces aquaticus]